MTDRILEYYNLYFTLSCLPYYIAYAFVCACLIIILHLIRLGDFAVLIYKSMDMEVAQ